jgi:Excalibur calcium-binding domain
VAALIVVGIVIATASQGDNNSSPQRPAGRGRHSPHRRQEAGVLGSARHGARRPVVCPSRARAFEGLYHPERLAMLDSCRRARGAVVKVRAEDDGDLHFDVRLDRRYRGLLRSGNFNQQGGALVVEFMPRDHGHLPAPAAGDRVSLVGAWVDDTDHAWNELHPVWAVSINGGRRHSSGPRFGGSPPQDRSYNALSGCRTAGGRHCHGYGLGGGVRSGRRAGLPPAGDKDCADFSTQAQAQRYFQSKGGPARDPDRLDGDGDGRACESLP